MAVLALVTEAPMHAYRMQQLIKERRKDDVINVAQRNSIYQTIERLRRDELIVVRETVREERRPERIVYEITEQGMATLRQWLRTMLSTPAREFPEFPAALACLPMLTPEDVLKQLEARAIALEAAIAKLDPQAASEASGLPRLFLVEDELTGAGAHAFRFRFHAAPGVEARVRGPHAELYDVATGARLLVVPSGVAPRAQIERRWSSRDYGQRAESHSLCWEARASTPFSAAFALVPVRAGEDERERLALARQLLAVSD
jgi:DNA-binding PadR family transcriptional regulator